MTAFLVWVPHPKKKEELQVWWFDPKKALRKRADIIRMQQIDDDIAEKLTLDELGKIYGPKPSDQL
jgi:hypothetical protein